MAKVREPWTSPALATMVQSPGARAAVSPVAGSTEQVAGVALANRTGWPVLSTAETVARSYTAGEGAGPNSMTPWKVKTTSWLAGKAAA